MAGKRPGTHTVEVGSITLHQLYGSLQDQLRQTMERSLHIGNQSLAERLDDVLIRQRFWEYDIHLKDGALSDLEASDTVASSIIRRYLDEMERSLSEMNAGLDDDTNNEKMSLISDINTSMCGKVEIFDAIAAIGDVDAAGKDRKSTAIGQLRCQLELENQKLRSQSGKEPQGTLRLLYSPEKVQKQAILDVVAVHSFNSEHKAAEQHALDTWRKPARENGRFWLRDDLPGAIPRSRIFLYEYDSIQAFEKKGHFLSAANDLLESLRRVRQEDPSSPLFFIAHGLGGLLVFQALVSAISSIIYESVYYSTKGIALFNTLFLPDNAGSTSRTQDSVDEVASDFDLPKNVVDTIYDSDLLPNFAEIQRSKYLPQFPAIIFKPSTQSYLLNETYNLMFDNVVFLNAAPKEVCRFDWSEHDQANLGNVMSKIEKIYTKVLEKAGSKTTSSQMTPDLNTSDTLSRFDVSFPGEDPGSTSSATTYTFKAAGSEKLSGHDIGASSSAKTQNPKASVKKSPSDEEIESRYTFPGKSA